MNYKKIYPLGKLKSRGSFEDFYSTKKYNSMEEAYEENDYVKCDFVMGDDGLVYIEASHAKNPEEKKYHLLNYQRFPAGLDALDDNLAVEMAESLF